MPQPEITTHDALAEIAASLPLLLRWVEEAGDTADIALRRRWHAPAATFSYQTTAAVDGAGEDLDGIADLFLHASRLDRQPWYPAFLSGASRPLNQPLPASVRQAFSGRSRFDFGLPRDRYYNQLIADLRPDAATRVVALRSISGLPSLDDAVRAFTLSPTADVFQRRGDRLLWHHIVTVAGAALLPPGPDRLLMNALRRLRLDRAERRTYLEEAAGFQALCRSGEWRALAPAERLSPSRE